MPSSLILVDAHVHFHACFDREIFLEAAWRNFADVARRKESSAPALGVLLMSECSGDLFFREFRLAAEREQPGPWVFRRTAEEVSLIAVRDGGARLAVVAGRQLVTAERLELLALGCDTEIEDRLPVRQALEAVRREDGLPVLPWGLGKWWFARGRVASQLVEEQAPSDFFLGDNGGRPRFLPPPVLFGRAEQLGLRVLPGSDPLPFAAQVRRVGAFGFATRAELSSDRPGASLKVLLRDDRKALEPYGVGQRLYPFLRSQLPMLLRKWGGHS